MGNIAAHVAKIASYYVFLLLLKRLEVAWVPLEEPKGSVRGLRMTLRITAHDCAHDRDPQEAGQRPLGIFQLRTNLSVVLCAPSHLHDIP